MRRLAHTYAMNLATWLSEHRLTDAAFGAKVGASQTTINRVRRGVQLPDLSLMDRIEECTAGAVTAGDLVATCREARRASAAAGKAA